jgi:hypothetical protein
VNKIVHAVGIIVIILTLGAEGMLLFGPKPAIDDLLLGRILGTLDAALLMVLTFYFGATISQQRGARSADIPPPPPPSPLKGPTV